MSEIKEENNRDLTYLPELQAAIVQQSKEKGFFGRFNAPFMLMKMREVVDDETNTVVGHEEVCLVNEESFDVLRRMSILSELDLIHSEASEASELMRTIHFNAMDINNKLGEELADIIIRTICLAGRLDIDITDAVVKKYKKNGKRKILNGKRI